MNENVRHLFPITKDYVYLNSAAVAPLPWTTVKEVNSALQDVMYNGSTHFMKWLGNKQRAREIIAGLLKVRPEQIAFMRNTSDGLSALANGISWQSGDNIVSFEREFPSNFYPWRRIRDQLGVEIRLCPEREGRIDLDEFISLINERTRVVAISAVQYGSGYSADLRRIGQAARQHGALFIVDFIQAFGAKTFDMEFVDAAAGSSHKWLCAPEGCGIMYLSDRAREVIEPTLVGWTSVEGWEQFSNSQSHWYNNALAWETGTGPNALYFGLTNSLELLRSVGIENIESHLGVLTDHLCDSLQGKNYEIVSSRAPGERSQIVCLNHRGGMNANDIYHQLEAKKIVVSAREGRLRIAPHLFNDLEDIDRLVEALP
ncbi:MAG TPA: aminotransferase class V-fold PLP-dependent enzyme [Pyrinomonadaceae bacterium]|jgi:selenocysteine lyase/cysteine desulfurase|nr:aminotransferase class V-fold PLP-dependent enzyme [Pyrinomonadaceae bacterium]